METHSGIHALHDKISTSLDISSKSEGRLLVVPLMSVMQHEIS